MLDKAPRPELPKYEKVGSQSMFQWLADPEPHEGKADSKLVRKRDQGVVTQKATSSGTSRGSSEQQHPKEAFVRRMEEQFGAGLAREPLRITLVTERLLALLSKQEELEYAQIMDLAVKEYFLRHGDAAQMPSDRRTEGSRRDDLSSGGLQDGRTISTEAYEFLRDSIDIVQERMQETGKQATLDDLRRYCEESLERRGYPHLSFDSCWKHCPSPIDETFSARLPRNDQDGSVWSGLANRGYCWMRGRKGQEEPGEARKKAAWKRR